MSSDRPSQPHRSRSALITTLIAIGAVAMFGPAAYRASSENPPVAAATVTESVVFADDFERGDLTAWTETAGVGIEQDTTSGGWVARAAAHLGTAFAAADLQTDAASVTASTEFFVREASTRVSLLKVRTAPGVAVSVGLDPRGRLLVFSSSSDHLTRTMDAPVEPDRWHHLELRLTSGEPGRVSVSLDGAMLADLSADTLRLPGPFRRIVIGSIASGRSYDVAFDDVRAVAPGDGGGGDVEAPSAPSGLRAPLVEPNEIRLRWEPSSDASGIARYTIYRDGAVLRSIAGDRVTVRDTSVQPGHAYTYAVDAVDPAGNRSTQSASLSVTTPTEPAGAQVLAAAGDIACHPDDPAFNGGAGTATACRMAATADLLEGADVVMPLGDIQYEQGLLGDFLASYDPSWGRFLPITRPVIGNHEYESGSPDGYFDYFGAAAGPRGGYYSFDVGSWHVVVLNSECDLVPCAPGSAQYAWLQADLASNPSPCTLAATHRPLFTSNRGGEPKLRPLWELLDGAGAEIVLSGHDHNYERFAPQDPTGAADGDGIRQFIVGTGGKSLHDVTGPTIANSEVLDDTSFGVLRLRLESGGYDWRFAPVGAGFTDAGTESCH